jgi:hypothetical protein
MLRSAPLFAAWCAAGPGSIRVGGSRLCVAPQSAALRPGHPPQTMLRSSEMIMPLLTTQE